MRANLAGYLYFDLFIIFRESLASDVAPTFLQDLEFVLATPRFRNTPQRKSALEIRAALLILRVSRSKLQIRFCTPNCLALVLPTRVMQIRRLYEITWNTASDTFTTTSRYAFSHPCIGYILLTVLE